MCGRQPPVSGAQSLMSCLREHVTRSRMSSCHFLVMWLSIIINKHILLNQFGCVSFKSSSTLQPFFCSNRAYEEPKHQLLNLDFEKKKVIHIIYQKSPDSSGSPPKRSNGSMWWLRQFLRIVKPLSVIYILFVYAFQYLSQDIREIETVSTRSSEYKWRKGKEDIGYHSNPSGFLFSINLTSQIQAMTNSVLRTMDEANLDLDLITKMSPSHGQMTSLLDTAQSQASAFTFHHNAILSAKDLKNWKMSPAVLTDSSGAIGSDSVGLWS